MVISLSRAYNLGGAGADDLALGLLMSWLPGLVSCAVVDRNPTSSHHRRCALQRFLVAAAAGATASAATAVRASTDGTAVVTGHNVAGVDQSGRHRIAASECVTSAVIAGAYISLNDEVPPREDIAVLPFADCSPCSLTATTRMRLQLPQPQPSACTPAAASSFLLASLATQMFSVLPQTLVAPRVGGCCGQGRRRWHYGLCLVSGWAFSIFSGPSPAQAWAWAGFGF